MSHYSGIGHKGWKPTMEKIATQLPMLLERHHADAYVVTGSSGILAMGALMMLDNTIPMAFIRKPGEDSHGTALEYGPGSWLDNHGVMGKRWILLDDFVSNGTTFKRVAEQLEFYSGDLMGAVSYLHAAGGEWTPFQAGELDARDALGRMERKLGEEDWVNLARPFYYQLGIKGAFD